MRKLTAWLLLMVMVFSASASSVALGEKSADAGKLPLTTEPIKLTIGLIPDDGVLDYDTNLYTAYLKEKTGVDIEFFYFPTTEFAQKLELMVAAQEELPDIILNMELEDTAKFSYGQQGVFLPLNEYFEQYGYYWQETYEKYCTEEEKNIISSLSVSPDGNVYGFPFYEVDPTDTQVETIYINKSWCDNLGLAVPTTTDELYEVLCAFRDNDPNGNGLKDEIPLLGYNSVDIRGDLIFILANSFLYYNWSEYGRFALEDGKLSASYTSEAFREALRYIHKLYEENLIAKEEFLKAQEDYELASKKYNLVVERLRQDSISRTIQMDEMETSLSNMRKNIALVHERKEHLNVRSQIDGELGLLDVVLGQNVSAGQKIGQINDLSDYKIEALIDEHYIDRVKKGLSATFERQGSDFELNVRKVYPEVRDGKFRTDFVFTGERPDNIRSGQTYYINLELGQPTESIIIPRGTFFQSTGGSWIFVLDKDGKKAYRRKIKIGRQNPQYYEVIDGLEAGEKVIVSSYESYKDNEVLVLE